MTNEQTIYQKEYRKLNSKKRTRKSNRYEKSRLNSNNIQKREINHQTDKYYHVYLGMPRLHDKEGKSYQKLHVFGFDDYRKFIYIPVELKTKIMKMLEENNIILGDVGTWDIIKDVVDVYSWSNFIDIRM